MPHASTRSTRAKTAVPATRRSTRLTRGSRHSDRSRSASRSDAGASSSPSRTPLTPAPRPSSRRTVASPAPPAPNTERVVEAPQAPVASPVRDRSRKVKPRGPVEAAEPPQSQPQPQQQPQPQPQLQPQPYPTDCSILVPFIVGLSLLLALAGPYLFKFVLQTTGLAEPQLHLEHALPLLTTHVNKSTTLLQYVQDLRTPLLDHLSVRVMRDAAGFSNLDTLRSDLHLLSEKLTDAKVLTIELGVGIWMAGSATHTELTHVLSSLTTSPVPMSATRVQHATEHVVGALANLRTTATKVHELLVSAHTLGTTIKQSTEWRDLETAAGSTRRMAWLGKQDGGLGSNVKKAVKTIERCEVLARVVEQVQSEVEGMLVNLREVGAGGARSLGNNEVLKMTEDLRAVLSNLASAVKRTDPNKT